jgi:UDP-glucuronate 4-epimerase
LPTTVARLSVPYGDNGDWSAIHLHMMLNGSAIPVHADAPSIYQPLHADDILAMVAAAAPGGVRSGRDRQLGRERAGQH